MNLRFALFLALMATAVWWLLAITCPLTHGLAFTYANLPLAVASALPAVLAMFAAIVITV